MYMKMAMAPSVKWRNFRVAAMSFRTGVRFAFSSAVSMCGSGMAENASTRNASTKMPIAMYMAGAASITLAFATSPPIR